MSDIPIEGSKRVKSKQLTHKKKEDRRGITSRKASVRLSAAQIKALDELAVRRATVLGIPRNRITTTILFREAIDRLVHEDTATELIEGVEARLSAGMVRTQGEIDRVRDDVHLLIAMLDQLNKFVLTTTPEIVDRQAAAVVGGRRRAAFLAELRKAMLSRGRRAKVATELMEEGEPNE